VRRPEYTASWRLLSETLSFDDLRRALGEPAHSHDRGDPVSSRDPSGAKRSKAMWGLESGLRRDQPLERHIETLIVAVEARQQAFAELRAQVYTDIFCGIFRNDLEVPAKPDGVIVLGCGFTLETGLLARLGALDLPLTCDIY
jgi:Domain of unknown function (DUF4279)